MLIRTYVTFLVLLFVLFITDTAFTQNILTHNTSSLQVSVYDNGYIGHNFDASTGNGVTFGAPDAMYTSGVVVGNSLTKTVGLVGSFTSGGLPVVKDWTTANVFGEFSSSANFNEIASCTLNDDAAPAAYKLGIAVHQTSMSNTGDNFIYLLYTVKNTSDSALNGTYIGIFADWDVGFANYALNRGGYDVSRNLVYQYENGGAVDSQYYGFVALNGIAGARVTANSAFGLGGIVRDSIFHWMSTFYNEPILANGDMRTVVGSGPFDLAAGDSVFVYFALVAGTNLSDLQAASDAAILKYNNSVIPVELIHFTASELNGTVTLNWKTATETNNKVFKVERKSHNSTFVTIGLIEGQGTSTEVYDYTFVDQHLNPGIYTYRLKQIDYDGSYSYSNEINVEIVTPVDFTLGQNYPNPFNPSTTINYGIAKSGNVRLTVYNSIGQLVETLVNEFKEPGNYNVSYNSKNISSGVYLYKLEAPGFVQIKKLVVNK